MTAKDKKGISALHYASGQGRLEVLQFLWSKGLDLDADDPGVHNPQASYFQLPLTASLTQEEIVASQPCQSIAGPQWQG